MVPAAIHTYTSTYIHTYIHTYTHTYVYTAIHTWAGIHTGIHTQVERVLPAGTRDRPAAIAAAATAAGRVRAVTAHWRWGGEARRSRHRGGEAGGAERRRPAATHLQDGFCSLLDNVVRAVKDGGIKVALQDDVFLLPTARTQAHTSSSAGLRAGAPHSPHGRVARMHAAREHAQQCTDARLPDALRCLLSQPLA